MQEHTAQKVIEHLSDLWVALHILFVRLDELIFSDGEVLEDLVIKVNLAKVQ